MARIRTRNGRHQVIVRVNGVERSVGTFDRKVDADRALREAERMQERTAGFDPSAGNVTVGVWAPLWLSTKHKAKPKTVAGYQSVIQSRIVPAFGSYPLNRITAGTVDQWVALLVDEGLSPSRIRQCHQTLGAMMKLAVRRGMIASNPCDGTELPAQIIREQRFLTASELQAVAEAMPGHLEAAVWTLGLAGLRFGELAALGRGDVDVLRRRIIVNKSVTEVNGQLVWGSTKNRKTRTVAVPGLLAGIVNDHLTGRDGEVAFPDSKGGTLRVSNFRQHVLTACSSAGVDPIRTHDLRHTAAALMLSVEPDLHLVMRQLGHSSIAVTVDRYGHLMPGRADQVADKLDAMLEQELASGIIVPINERKASNG